MMMFLVLLAQAENPVVTIGNRFGWHPQLFISQLVLFLIVAFAFKKWAIGPLQRMLEERRQRIAESLENAEKIKAELARAEEQVTKRIGDAGAQANKIIEEARSAAAKVGEAERQKAIADAANIIAKAREAGEAELVRMKGELRKEFGRLVVAAAAQASGKILTLEDQRRLADETNKQIAA